MRKPNWLDSVVLDAYELPESVTAQPLLGGLQHEVWKVSTAKKQVVLKKQFVKPSDTALALEDVATQESIACAKLIRTVSGNQVLERKGTGHEYFIRAYEYIDGNVLGRQAVNRGLAFSLGGMLADLHTASQKHLQHMINSALPNPLANYYLIDELDTETANALHKFTFGFDITGRQAVIGHRDISGKNTIVAKATGKPYLIDFDEAGLTTVDGEVIDAAFNMAGVHTEEGPVKEVVKAFVKGYRDNYPSHLHFDELSFHNMLGLSEYFWLGVCLNRIRDGRTSENKIEEREKARLLKQIPRDLKQVTEWLTWLND